ncbi:MAG: hypothetical protein ACP5NO_05805 [Thermoplasmata archaeon]
MIEMVLEPSLKTMSKGTSFEFVGKFIPKLGIFMGIFSTLTIAMGPLLLFSITSGAIPRLDGTWGMLIFIGIITAVIVYAFGLIVLLPLSRKIENAYKSSSFDRMEKLMATLRRLMAIDLAGLVIVFTVMVTAAFL